MSKKYRIVLAGNPNCGKTCIFNALTGTRQHVGNYPGVTVESKSGIFNLDDLEIEVIDLPGIYSLSSSSPEETVAFEELTKKGIDLILNVVDSTILQRSFYLTTQLAELHIPMLLVFNMSDDARKKGLTFDIPKFEQYFGAPIVQTVGNNSNGVKELKDKLITTLANLENHGMPMLSYGADFDDAINEVAKKIEELNIQEFNHIPARFFAIKLLEKDSSAMKITQLNSVLDEVDAQILHLKKIHAIDADTFMADRRYAMLSGACHNAISFSREKRQEISDKIDKVVINKFLGFPLFLAIMYGTFYFTFICAEPFMGYIEDFFGWLASFVGDFWHEGTCSFIRSLVVDGIIPGVGGVIVFLPNILLLFFAIAILEESGYMSRAAFVMDGLMRKFGLQGKSFVPLVLGFGCTVPAIMATRTIESEKDRKITIMVLPFMSCGARLPIYALIIPAFFAKEYQAFTMWVIYLIGVLVALIAARLMKSTLFKGDGEVYLMELPPYRMPSIKGLLLHMWDRGKMYLQKAGTIILLTSIILYICNTYPEKKEFSTNYEAKISQVKNASILTNAEIAVLEKSKLFDHKTISQIKESKTISKESLEQLAQDKENSTIKLTPIQEKIISKLQKLNEEITTLENSQLAEKLEYTISGRVGKALEVFFAPLGFDWKITTATIGALAAKEVFVAQMGILYSEGEADEESDTLRQQLVKHYSPLQAFCIMLFCLLSIPCLATLAIIKRELNSWKMASIEAVALFALAYVTTLIVYQIGSFLEIGTKML